LLKFKTKGGSLFGSITNRREEPPWNKSTAPKPTNPSSLTSDARLELSVIENVQAQNWQGIEGVVHALLELQTHNDHGTARRFLHHVSRRHRLRQVNRRSSLR